MGADKITDASVIRERRRERVKRSERGMSLFSKYMFFLVFGIPIVVVLSFHFIGWKAAVSVFPFLFGGLRLSLRAKQNQRGVRLGRMYFKDFVWATVCIIPILSIATAEPGFMRLWALAAALALSANIMNTGLMAKFQAESANESCVQSRATTFAWSMAPGFLFVAGSEAIWLFSTISVWIWYHAFFFQIFLGLTGLFFWLKRAFGGERQQQDDTIIQALPPSARSRQQGERHTVCAKQTDGSWLKYKNITLGQACRVFESFNQSVGEVAVNHAINEERVKTQHVFHVDFDGFTYMNTTGMALDGQSLLNVKWQYMTVGASYLPKLPFKLVNATRVPAALMPEILELGWREDWDRVASLLGQFANAGDKVD